MAAEKTKRVRKPKAKAVQAELMENSIFSDALCGSGTAPFNNFMPQWANGGGARETISGLGTLERNLRYFLISNYRQLLSWGYVEIGLIQTMVDVPVDDGLRGGVKFKSQQLDEDQIAELLIKMDTEDDLTHVATAGKWNRLYGGAGLIVMSDQDPEESIDLDAIGPDDKIDFRPADVWELFWATQNIDPFAEGMQLSSDSPDYFDYYGKRLHKSRVMTLKGLTPPSFIAPRLRGWGFSCVEPLIRSLNQYIKGTDLLFEVLDEFKVDVYRFKNLANSLLSPDGAQKLKERVATMNYHKNFQNAVVLDQEDEYDHKQLSFAGLAEAKQDVRMQVASDLRMPLTKLFGISAAGFNSGEDDIEVYNAMVEAQVRRKLKFIILQVAKIRCQQLFQFVPDDLQVEFEPLRVMSSEQQENVKTQKSSRALAMLAAGAISLEEFRDVCNKGNVLDIVLDNNDALLTELEEGMEAAEEGAADDGNADQEGAKPRKTAKDKRDLAKDAPKTPKTPEQPKKERTTQNSATFDKASYLADGGAGQFDARRLKIFEDPALVNQALWAQAKAAAHEAMGKEDIAFTLWWYKKMGGYGA